MPRDLGIAESATDEVIKKSYALLGLISFLTAGEPEVRAWTITRGTSAQKAAGVIHSDIERGFIRAEVTSYEDYVELKTPAAIKAAGKQRLEGKEYVVQDGDVILFRFNV
jgi:ribosome-binding ATPase YchF (GTP1/OBG family)